MSKSKLTECGRLICPVGAAYPDNKNSNQCCWQCINFSNYFSEEPYDVFLTCAKTSNELFKKRMIKKYQDRFFVAAL